VGIHPQIPAFLTTDHKLSLYCIGRWTDVRLGVHRTKYGLFLKNIIIQTGAQPVISPDDNFSAVKGSIQSGSRAIL
jgi:hypothetical protein